MKDNKRITISVFRSNKYIYAQAIDGGVIVASSSSLNLKKEKSNKIEQAKMVGIDLAKKLKAKKVVKGLLNRKKYAYHGRVKSLTEGLREGGLEI
jgi:large subunit ribosomal protein L18